MANSIKATNCVLRFEQIQIIDEGQKFSRDLAAQVDRWGLRDCGYDYSIVTVFGFHSTGKSTLLEKLFGTPFDYLDKTQQSQRTAKGVWMSRAKDMNVLIMDIEGMDDREHGVNHEFQRMSAIFSLASSEILIINLWEHQVGVYNGQEIGKLYEPSHSSSLCDSRPPRRDPLAILQDNLTADLQNIWDSIPKPPELSFAQLSDYFDLTFSTLPSKTLVADHFENEIRQLRGRFISADNKSLENGYLFEAKYHKNIPADCLACYMKYAWEQVRINKVLESPTQELLVQFTRCDELLGSALSEFNEHVKEQWQHVEAGRVVEGLGTMMRDWRLSALGWYDRGASQFHQHYQGISECKRAELLVSLDETLSSLFRDQIKNLHKLCLIQLRKEILEGVKNELFDFTGVIYTAKIHCETRFKESAAETFMDGMGWDWQEQLELLKEEADVAAESQIADERAKRGRVYWSLFALIAMAHLSLWGW